MTTSTNRLLAAASRQDPTSMCLISSLTKCSGLILSSSGTRTSWYPETMVANLMMLNVDMALVRDFSGGYLPADFASKFCTFKNPVQTRCPLAPSLGKAEEYSQDNLLWLNDFKAVILKMLAKNP